RRDLLDQFRAVLLRRRARRLRPLVDRVLARLDRQCRARQPDLRHAVERRVLAGGVFGVVGVALMFYPELGGMRLDIAALIGLALSLAGTVCFCIGNMLSLAAQRRGLPIFAT